MSRRIGVDLGGTKIEAVLAEPAPGSEPRSPGLRVLARRRVATGRERGYEAILETAAALVAELAREAGAPADAPVGIGMPGGLSRAGLVKNSNTTCLNGRPFRQDLAARLAPRRAVFENDANCFALAEARLGAGRPHVRGVVFGVILGTGVGGGVVVDGRLWPGPHGVAGEWGHHAVFPGGLPGEPGGGRPCYCGNRGCLESYASGPAVEADYARRAGAPLPLAEIAARRATDPHAAAAIETLLAALARGLANVIDILDPSAIVLGGGVSNLAALYGEGAARARSLVFGGECGTPILKHEVGDSAGVLGAALLADG